MIYIYGFQRKISHIIDISSRALGTLVDFSCQGRLHYIPLMEMGSILRCVCSHTHARSFFAHTEKSRLAFESFGALDLERSILCTR